MELRVVNPKTLAFNPNNPRQIKAAPEMDAQLTANIKAVGVISPPLVRETAEGLEIIAGERRVRCAIAAGVTDLHVLISQAEDGSDPIRALAENTQRSPMNPVDQWRAFEALFAAGWNEEAVGTAFSITPRTMRKMRLLAAVYPKMLDRMAFSMPREDELRTIASAPLEEQVSVWKKWKPKRGEGVYWGEIARALSKRQMPARDAAFDDETAKTFGIVWRTIFSVPRITTTGSPRMSKRFSTRRLIGWKRCLSIRGWSWRRISMASLKCPPAWCAVMVTTTQSS